MTRPLIKINPPESKMDEILEQMKREAEEERKRIYLARYGRLVDPKEPQNNRNLKEFN